jgi:hypothetical protein
MGRDVKPACYYPFTHSFIQQTSPEHLVYARPCHRHWGYQMTMPQAHPLNAPWIPDRVPYAPVAAAPVISCPWRKCRALREASTGETPNHVSLTRKEASSGKQDLQSKDLRIQKPSSKPTLEEATLGLSEK